MGIHGLVSIHEVSDGEGLLVDNGRIFVSVGDGKWTLRVDADPNVVNKRLDDVKNDFGDL